MSGTVHPDPYRILRDDLCRVPTRSAFRSNAATSHSSERGGWQRSVTLMNHAR